MSYGVEKSPDGNSNSLFHLAREKKGQIAMEVVVMVLSLCVLFLLMKFLYSTLIVPRIIQRHFNKQGISGPKYRFLFGNSGDIQRLHAESQSGTTSFNHDVLHKMIPHFAKWSADHGANFLYWFGCTPRLVVSDPQMVKEVLTNASGSITKVDFSPLVKSLTGEGVATLDGDKWAKRRRIVNQGFTSECIKNWMPEIVGSAAEMVEKWDKMRRDGDEFEVDMHREFNKLSADIIAKTAFGSSYEKGKMIFELQEESMLLVSKIVKSLYLPGFRFLPTKDNRERERLNKETCNLIKKLIIEESGIEGKETRKNLLSILMASHGDETLNEGEIIDECKGFYFAGKETAASAMTWSILLLALHQEWQEKAREEVLRVLGREPISAEKLKELKIVHMILNESLRLYPIVTTLTRKTTRKMKLGELDIPAGTQFDLPLAAIQRNVELWGPDANEFNPARFYEPRKHLAAFMPFGMGPRICVGQHLYVFEWKIVLATIIRDYSFRVSPTYVHSPRIFISLEPKHGAQVLFSKILP